MELKELTYNKRNTLQIHNLVKVTTDVLKHKTETVHVPIYGAQDSQIQSGLEITLEEETKIEVPGQVPTVKQPKQNKDEDSNVGKSLCKTKKIIFDEACKYFSSTIDTSINTNEVTTTFRHKESKHSGHSVESEKPNIYEIYHPPESVEFMVSLIVVLQQIITNDNMKIEKHVLLHYNVEKDIPNIFYMAFKMMGVLEKVTNRYEEFKNVNSKKIFIASFRAFRGLEYPRVVVVLDRNVSGLEQYLPECLNRCTTYLHVILLKKDTCMLEQTLQEGTALQNIIAAWKMQYKNKKLINYWRVHIFGSHTDKARTKFYEKRDLGVIKINSTSRKYKELEANFGKLQCLKNENTNEEKIIQEEVESAVAR